MTALRSLLPLVAVALLGTGFTRVHVSPSTVHMRWTVHYHDVVATTDEDVPAADESESNSDIFPLSGRGTTVIRQHMRIVVAGRTVFDRALTRDESKRLGAVYMPLHLADDLPGAGKRDLVGQGNAMLQYRASPPGYRLVPAPAAAPYHPSRHLGCDRKGSFELDRVASRGGTTARLVQRGDLTTCVIIIWPNEAALQIASADRTAYAWHHEFTKREQLSMPDVAGALRIIDGPAFVDFEGTGSPSIVLTGSTGGAHCCYRTHVFYRRERSYGEAVRTWGNSSSYPALVHDARSGEILFGSSNDTFASMFGYANSVEPVQIFAFERGRFLDVTDTFPDVVREQSDRTWKRARTLLAAKKTWQAQAGLVAYVAEMSALHRDAEAWRNIRSACTARDCASYLHDIRAALKDHR